MSADNWAVCPQCLARAKKKYEANVLAVSEAYGKISVEQFDKQRDTLGEPPTEDTLEPTFREDYEFGMTQDGEFYATYNGKCSECSFSHLFKHAEQLTVEE